jgi:hypothetical protein
MKKLILGMAAASALLIAAPASADSVGVRIGGVGVHVGSHHHHHRWHARPRHGCRTVTVRTHRANGTVVTRKSRRC